MERIDLGSLLESIRREHCTWSGDRWLCRCGAELPTDDAIMCAPCREASAQRAEREARAQRMREHWARVEQLARRGLDGAPDWQHARVDSEAFLKLHPKMQAFARRYAKKVGNVALFGPSGCGKTTAVLAALRRLGDEAIQLERERRRWDHGPELLWLSEAKWTTGHAIAKARRQHGLGEGEAPLIAAALNASLLVIDEIGYEPLGEVLFEVMDARYAQHLPTLITSGLTAAGFRDRYGDAFFRRLADKRVGSVIEVPHD